MHVRAHTVENVHASTHVHRSSTFNVLIFSPPKGECFAHLRRPATGLQCDALRGWSIFPERLPLQFFFCPFVPPAVG